MQRVLGTGWELSVFRCDDRLILGMPVENHAVGASFDFDISEGDLAVLRDSLTRRKVLEFILHDRLQRRMERRDHAGAQDEVRGVIARVLHGSKADLQAEIAASPMPEHVLYRLQQSGIAPIQAAP